MAARIFINFRLWLKSLRRQLGLVVGVLRPYRASPRKLAASRLCIEQLEIRCLPSGSSVLQDLGNPISLGSSTNVLAAGSRTHEVVFVDTGVQNWQQLVKDIQTQASPNVELDVFSLNRNDNGIQAIGAILAGYHNLDAIQIISHGADGEIKLGDALLSEADLSAYQNDLHEWGASLRPNADILLYGCDVAENQAGRQFVNDFANLTGAHVAANTALTGNAAQGGDWNLNYHAGPIDVPSLFAHGAADWTGLLAITQDSVSSGQTSSASTLTFSHTIGSGNNGLLLVEVAINHGGTTVSSVTYDGASLTYLNSASQGPMDAEIWYLTAPATGTFNVVVTASANADSMTAGATSYFGVSQLAPLGTAATANGKTNPPTPSVTVTSATGQLVVAVAAIHQGTTYTAGTGQTELWSQNYANGVGGPSMLGVTDSETGAASVTASWSVAIGGGGGEWAEVGVAIKPLSSTTTLTSSASITQDSVSSAQTTAASTLTFAHTVGSGSNGLLLVEVTLNKGGTTVSSVTYNGTSLTYLNSASQAMMDAEIWYLKAPASGTYNVVVTTSGNADSLAAGATSYFNVNQTTPLGTAATANGKTNPPTASVTVSSASGDVVVAVAAVHQGTTYTAGSNQTELWNQNYGSGSGGQSMLGVSDSEPGASSVTASWSVAIGGGGGEWAEVGVSINPAAVSTTYGQSQTFTATVSGGTSYPTGTVTFECNGTSIGTGTLSSGVATLTTGAVPVGTNTITAVYGGDSNYPGSTSAGLTVTVTAVALTVTASAETKIWGQTLTFSSGSTLFTSSVLQNGETIGSVTLAVSGSGGAATAALGSYTITASAATGGTFTASNYTITYVTGSLTVNPAPLTITASAETKTYGQTVTFGSDSTLFTTSGLQNGDTLGTVTLAVNNGGDTATAAVGSYTITPSAVTGGTFTASNYSITYPTGALTVNAAALTITASAESKTYGQTVTFGSGSTLFATNGLQNGDTLGTVTLAVNNSGGAATAAVGSYTITPSAVTGGTFTASNYSITYATGALTVNAAALTITASAESKTYGQTVSFGSGSTLFTSSGLQNGDTLGTVTLAVNNSGGAATAAVGSYTITPSAVTGGTFTASNYSISYVTGTLTVNTATLTVTASAESKTYGQTVTFGSGSTLFTSSGLQNSETIGTVTLAVSSSGGAATAAVGSYTITASAAAGGTFTSSNYSITYATGALTVNAAALTIIASAESKTYGQTVTFGSGSTLVTSSGLQNGDTLGTVTLAVNNSGGAATAAVGSYTITPSAVTGGTFTASNYSITYTTGTLTVNAAALTVTASAESKTYGQTVTFGSGSTLFTSSGLQNGDTLGTVTLAVNNGGDTATAAVGSYTITPSAATGGTFTASNYSISYPTGALTVNAAALTITASAESKTYGQTVTFGSGSTLFATNGLQNGDTLGTVTLAVNNSGGAATAAVGSYTITPSAVTGGTFTASNYSITYATGALTVNAAALTVTASAESKTYGQTVTFGSGSTLFTTSGLQNGDTLGTVTLAVNNSGGAATAAVGSYTITPSAVTGGTFTASNYSITYATGTLTVNTAALTVTASAESKTYGQTVTFGSGSALFTSSGLQNGDTLGTVTLAVNNSGGAATAAVGSYTITPSAATGGTFTASNYSISYVTGTLTVNAAALTVTASAESKTFGQTTTFGSGSTLFTSSGLQNGDTLGTVTLAVNNSGGAATAAVGSYTITPSAVTGGTFTASNYSITYATGTLTVNTAALTVTASAESKTYGQTLTFGSGSTLFTSSGLENGDTLGTATLAVNNSGGAAASAVGSYTIIPSAVTGGTFTASNYSITYATDTLTVNAAALTITASAQSKTYGQTVTFGSGSTLFTSSGLQNGDTLGTVTLAVNNSGGAATAAVGSYTITPSAVTGGTFTASNYSITYPTGALTVNAAALTITASAEGKTYGQTVTFASGSTLFATNGLQNGDTLGTVTLAVNNSGGAATAAVGSYTITPSAVTGGTFTASNYSITYATGALTVNAAALTIIASAESKTYGQTVTFGSGSTLFTSSGLQNGDTLGTVTLAVNNSGGAATAAVGSYTITPSAVTGGTFTASNYSITYATGTLTVNAAALTVTASAESKTFGQTTTFGSGSTLFTSSGLQNGDTLGTATLAVNNSGGAATAAVGSYTITPSAVTGGTFTASNYSITYATGALTVNAAALTVTASAESKTYGQTVTFGSGSTLFTSSGLQNGDTLGTVTLAVNNSGGAATAAAGSYTITPSAVTGGTFTASNYSITYATGTLTVNAAALTITASAESKTYGQTVTFGSGSTLFTSSGLQNGDTLGTVTLAVNNSGGAATAAVGTYTITPSAVTGGTFTARNYRIAYLTGTLTVNPATLAITAGAAFGVAATDVGVNTKLTFTITNPAANSVALSGINFTDTLPVGLVVATPNGYTGTTGGGTVIATAGANTISLNGATLAAGASLRFCVNVIATATGPMTNSLTVASTNGGHGNTSANLAVNALPTIGNASTNQWTRGAAIAAGQVTLTIANGTPAHIIHGIPGLPPGLRASVNGNTINITGTPSVACSSFNCSITIQDAADAMVTKTFAITIIQPLTFTPAALPAYTVGQAYSQTITTAGGNGARLVTYTLSGPLPAGMTIQPASPTTGAITISGTPTTLTNITLTVTVTDSVGVQETITYTLTAAVARHRGI